tara:strand:- start:731 stop:1483 length:753 start_codon:yes stop_codon:yes gene_type:complete
MTSIVLSPDVAPVTPEEGEIYYDSSSDKLKLRDASGFREIVSENSSGQITGTFTGTVSSSATVQGNIGSLEIATSTFTGTVANTATLPSFVGMVASFAMTAPPTGWLACDGSAVSRTTYSDLFAAIGSTWGSGNGSSTFNVPDLRGAFLRGTGSHGTNNMADGNDFAGPSVGSFENDQFQGHGHTLYSKGGYGNGDAVVSMRDAPSGSGVFAIEDRDGFVQQPVDFGNSSPRYGDETRPFNAGVKYCIKF